MADVQLFRPVVNVKVDELNEHRRRVPVEPVIRLTGFTEHGNGRTMELTETQAINLATNILVAARDAKMVRIGRQNAVTGSNG